MSQREVHIMLEGLSETERTRLLTEMSEGYKQAAEAFEQKRLVAEEAKDAAEERANRGMVIYCETMAALVLNGVLDEPEDNHLSFYAFDERIGDKRLLLQIMADVDEGRSTEWTPAHLSVIGGALFYLTAKERHVAEAYYIARMRRTALAEMLGMPIMTLDTHIKNINAKFREYVGAVERSEPVQASWLGSFLEIGEMEKAKVRAIVKGATRKKGA